MSEVKKHGNWSCVYEKAIKDDGTLWFPERLSEQFLSDARALMGTRLFANQYLNEIFPSDDAVFKESWFKDYTLLPDRINTVAFIDPAISMRDGADFTGITVVSSDSKKNWYIRVAKRERLNPTQIVNLCFELHDAFRPQAIGIEKVAFQEALLYMLHEEMQRRGKPIPVTGIYHGNQKTKEMRISGALVPRMEWGFVHFPIGPAMDDVKRELLQFPSGAHDDIIDSLASCESIMTYPNEERGPQYEQFNPHNPGYERNVIDSLVRRANDENE